MTEQPVAPSGLIWASQTIAIETIRRLLAAGDLKWALPICLGAVSQFDGAELRSLLGYCYQQLGYDVEALAACDVALSQDSKLWLAHTVRGHSLLALDRLAEARHAYEAAAAIDPGEHSVLEKRIALTVRLDGVGAGRALLATEGAGLSAEAASEVMTRASDAAAASRLSEATDLLSSGNLEESITALRAVANDFPDSADAWAKLAYALRQSGQRAEALSIAMSWCNRFPDRWLLSFLAGATLKESGQTELACKYLRQASDLWPTDDQTLRLLTQAVAESEGMDAAVSEYAMRRPGASASENVLLAPLSSVRNWAEHVGAPILEVGEIEQIPFKAPHVWGGEAASEVTFAPSNKPYVAELPNARVFGKSSIILTSDGTALSDTAGHAEFGAYVSFQYEQPVIAHLLNDILLDFSQRAARQVDAAVCLSGLASDAFGHWFPEFLPKLQFLREHPDFKSLPIIVDAEMPASHFEHLRRFADNEIILLRANEMILCRRLIVASPPAFLPVDLLPNEIPLTDMPGLSLRAMRFLQTSTHPRSSELPCRRLFLARKNMRWRRLLNESEIESGLQHLGFETIHMEEMSAREQIDLFRQAAWIVAPNGSALLNLIFADTSAKLLVLCQPNLFNWGTFQGPMDALGYQSLCISGDFAVSDNQKHSDYRVPLSRVRDALKALGFSEL